jgi:hypothetical protein
MGAELLGGLLGGGGGGGGGLTSLIGGIGGAGLGAAAGAVQGYAQMRAAKGVQKSIRSGIAAGEQDTARQVASILGSADYQTGSNWIRSFFGLSPANYAQDTWNQMQAGFGSDPLAIGGKKTLQSIQNRRFFSEQFGQGALMTEDMQRLQDLQAAVNAGDKTAKKAALAELGITIKKKSSGGMFGGVMGSVSKMMGGMGSSGVMSGMMGSMSSMMGDKATAMGMGGMFDQVMGKDWYSSTTKGLVSKSGKVNNAKLSELLGGSIQVLQNQIGQAGTNDMGAYGAAAAETGQGGNPLDVLTGTFLKGIQSAQASRGIFSSQAAASAEASGLAAYKTNLQMNLLPTLMGLGEAPQLLKAKYEDANMQREIYSKSGGQAVYGGINPAAFGGSIAASTLQGTLGGLLGGMGAGAQVGR